jgi:hypothetical protein
MGVEESARREGAVFCGIGAEGLLFSSFLEGDGVGVVLSVHGSGWI